jgi:hypothetical protein
MRLATAGASTASGATVQITLTGNKISSTGNQLNADLTGDLNADVQLDAAIFGPGGVGVSVFSILEPTPDGPFLSAQLRGSTYGVDARFASGGIGVAYVTGAQETQSITFLNPVTFSDLRINGGSPTGGWLQVNAFNTSATNHTVELARLIFDDANTTRPGISSIPGVQTEWVAAVPEPGSNLALLALGAGGLTLRRRLKRAA